MYYNIENQTNYDMQEAGNKQTKYPKEKEKQQKGKLHDARNGKILQL